MNKITEYFASKRVSNSLLGTIQNPKFVWLKQKGLIEDEDKIYFRIGSAIDCLLTNKEEWENEFYVSKGTRPGGLLGKFVEKLPPNLSFNSKEEEYLEAYNYAGYKASLSNVIKWFWEATDVVQYYKDRFITTNKTILTKEEYEIVNNAVQLILENPLTEYFFRGDQPHIERLLQLPIYFEWNDLECKALLDGLLIDHKNKTIQPFDLKTVGKGVFQFSQSFYQFGYYRQAAFYCEALKTYIKQRDLYDSVNLSEYTILPFKFIVIDNKLNTHAPALIYEVSENDLKVGMTGGKIKQTQETVPGLIKLADDYKWHVSNNKWLLPKDMYINKSLPLNVFYENQQS